MDPERNVSTRYAEDIFYFGDDLPAVQDEGITLAVSLGIGDPVAEREQVREFLQRHAGVAGTTAIAESRLTLYRALDALEIAQIATDFGKLLLATATMYGRCSGISAFAASMFG